MNNEEQIDSWSCQTGHLCFFHYNVCLGPPKKQKKYIEIFSWDLPDFYEILIPTQKFPKQPGDKSDFCLTLLWFDTF